MLKFRCPECSQKLTTREDRGGTVSRCPRCKARLTIPQLSQPQPVPELAKDNVTLIAPARPKPLDRAMLDLPDEQMEAERRREEERLLTSFGVVDRSQNDGDRRLPWPIDILLYPMSRSGLMVLTVLIGAPLLFTALLASIPALGPAAFLFLSVTFALGLYNGWYLSECIYDSALGSTRAPYFLGVADGLWSRVVNLLTVCLVYLFPPLVYGLAADRVNLTFVILAASALVFFPIALLAIIVNDSLAVLNPVFLLKSISRVTLPYVGLLLLLVAVGTVYWFASQTGTEGQTRPFWAEALGAAASTYTTFVLAHVLGRFYWHYAERLEWES